MGDNQALREQIAQAIANRLDGQRFLDAGMDSQRIADHLTDAVLPVVQAHEKDLLEEIEELAIDLAEERALHQSLRDAVARLAESLDDEARNPQQWIHVIEVKVKEDAARRLRSLLPQEGQR